MLRRDEELRAEILQDVERLPEKDFYQKPATRRMLVDILFIFCKLNPDVGYRQGMHELAAPILWAIDHDAVDVGDESKALGESALIKNVFDVENVEHDAFTIFGQVMQNAKSFYLSEGASSIATRSREIFNELLPQIDPALAKHLENLDVLPQVYLIRWIRLLFGREFDFEDVLSIWDIIFAEDPSLEIVNHVCLVMLLKIRWQLLDADYNGALALLLRYPEPGKEHPPQTFVLDALYLRTHLDLEGAGYLVLKHTGKALPRPGRPSTPPALQRNITTFSGTSSTGSPERRGGSSLRTPRQARNIEAILQNTAKNIYARGEKLGLGKAVRSAVDEVHKKAQEIRDAQASSPSPWRRSGPTRLQDRLRDFEQRNKRLSDLLSGAVSELWDCQRAMADGEASPTESEQKANIEKLSTAIAKAQFVQVYLNEPSLQLPEDGSTGEESSSDKRPSEDPLATQEGNEKVSTEDSTEHLQPVGSKRTAEDAAEPTKSTFPDLADPSSFEDDLETPSYQVAAREEKGESMPNPSIHVEANDPVDQAPAVEEKSPRPSLAQSSYSFMLGQAQSFGSADPFAPEHGRAKTSLFGDDDAGKSQSRRKSSFLSHDAKSSIDDTDEFDMSTLKRAKGTKN